jgi:DNA repair exonuclease SbcCD ATPase subunit
MNNTLSIEVKVMPPDVESAVTELSCPSDKVFSLYKPFEEPFQKAAALMAEEEKATTAADARALRLKMVKARTSITATKDESKSDIKLAGNIIDWFHNKGRDRLVAAESRLMEIEKAEERAEAARIEAIREERAEVLDSLEHNYHGISLGTMADEHWKEYLEQAKDLHEIRKQREAKAEAERVAELKRQEEEREAARLEAIRLNEEREKALAEARAEAEAARKEREAQAAAAEAERKAAAAEAKRKDDELIAAHEKARKEREAAEAEAKALRDKEAKRIAEEQAAIEAKRKADELAARKAAAAPDKLKIDGFASTVRALEVPPMKSEAGKVVANEIAAKVASFAKWIETQSASL